MGGPQKCLYDWCAEPSWEGCPDGYCLFHSPDNVRDAQTAERVWQEAKEKVSRGDLDFRRWHFPPDRTSPRGKRGFRGVRFTDAVNFHRAIFERGADFRDVVFEGPADFAQADFEGQAHFGRTEFAGRAMFWNAKFQDDADFSECKFAAEAEFRLANFRGTASFYRATFEEQALFSKVRCKEKAIFTAANFLGNAEFANGMFDGDFWLDEANFRGRALLSELVVGGHLTCAASCFSDAAFFGKTEVKGYASFQKVTFADDVAFSHAAFRGGADFESAKFARVGFDYAKFQELAIFSSVKFSEQAMFARAHFKGVAEFEESAFHGDVEFSGVKFSSGASFAGAVFLKAANFMAVQPKPGYPFYIDLPGRSLSSADSKGEPTLGIAAQEAHHPFHIPEKGALAYRVAKEAARAAGDYRMAGEYHYAEQCAMERGGRKQNGWRFWRISFWKAFAEFFFVRGVFGYGERPLRPLYWAMGIILLWAALFWLAEGITPQGVPALSYTPSFLECVYFSLVTFTTVGYGDMQPKPWLQVQAGVESFLGVVLMATFIVSLTRRYTR